MFFSYCSGQQQIDNNNKCRRIAGDFDCHVDAAVRHGAHLLMEHIHAYAVSPRRTPWLTNLLKQHKTLTKHNF